MSQGQDHEGVVAEEGAAAAGADAPRAPNDGASSGFESTEEAWFDPSVPPAPEASAEIRAAGSEDEIPVGAPSAPEGEADGSAADTAPSGLAAPAPASAPSARPPGELPDLPAAGEPHEDGPFAPVPEDEVSAWEELVASYESEARALGENPRAALLHLEIGRIREEKLGQPRAAATAYQTAFNIDPREPAVLHASRRLFTEVGNWAMVVQIIGYQLEGAGGREERATLLSEKGGILEHELRDLPGAREAYEAALETWSAEPLAVTALERIHLFEKRHDALFEVYERALEVEEETERRLPLLLAAGALAEDRLERPERAIELYEEASRLDRAHPVALDALRRLHQQRGNAAAMVEVLERSAEVASDDGSAAQYFGAAARLARGKLERPDVALRLVRRALERAPSDLAVLRDAELLHREAGETAEVMELLRRAADVSPDPRERATFLHRLGRALEAEGDLEGATAAAREALEAEPSFLPAAQALGRCLEASDRPEELAALYRAELEHESDPAERVARLFKLAELYEGRLDDEEGALGALRELLSVEREYQPARKRLEQLLLRKEAFDELVALHEEEVDLTADDELKIFLLGRIGALAEEKLGDLERAKRAMERLLELSPKHLGAIRALGRIAERTGSDRDLLRLLEREAEATEDQPEVLALMHRRATLLGERLDDEEAAVEVLEQLLTLNPSYLPALRSLGRIHAKNERWDALVEMHRRELEGTKSPRHRVDLLFRMAGLLEERVGDLDGAVRAYEEALALDPDNLAARRALASLYARRGEAEPLVRLRLEEVERAEAPEAQAWLLIEAAELCEERLDRGDQAADLYQRALRLGHGVDVATRALVRIYSREGMWNALVGALRAAVDRAPDNATKAAVLVRAAQVHGEKLKKEDVAAELLEEALELEPESRPILEQLERTSIARRDWVRAVAVGERLAAMEADPRSFAARHIRLAQTLETQLQPPRSGAEHYRKALEAVPEHPIAMRALESAYLAARDFGGLAAVAEREAEIAARGPAHRASLLVRAADLRESRLGEPEAAAALYERALAADPACLPALRGRRRLAEAAGDTARALELLSAEGAQTADPARGSDVLFETGRVEQEQLGRVDRAVEAFERVLERDPRHLGAFNRLEAIFLEREEHSRLQALLQRRASAVESTEEQARLLVSSGVLAEEQVGDRDAAIEAYRAALEREPKNASALYRLGPLLFSAERWAEAIEVFHRTLAVAKEPPTLRDAFKSLGIIYQEHQKDLVKSVQSYQAALQADPSDTESLYRLASLYRGARDWSSAINVMLRLAEVEPEAQGKTRALLELAELYMQGPGDGDLAIMALRKAVEVDARCRPALERLCELHEERKEWPELVEAAGAYVNLLGPEERKEALPLHLRMADVFERRLGDDHRAINALRYVLEERPTDQEALERLAALYAKKVETYPQAVEAHRRLLVLDPFRVASYHELHRMFERLGEHDRAFVAAEILVFLQAQTSEEYVYFQENKHYVAQMSDGVLSPEEHTRFVVHPDERGAMRATFELLSSELGRAFPGQLERHELKRENKLGPRVQHPVRALADELAGVLGQPAFDLWIGRAEDAGVYVESERPPAIVIGGRFAKRVPSRDQRFLLGRAVERVRGGHQLFEVAGDRELETLLWSVAKLGSPNQQVPIDPARLDASQRKLQKSVSSRARRSLEEVGRDLFNCHVDMARHRAAAARTANRAGLLMSNDIETALRIIARERSSVRAVFTDAKGAAEVLGPIPEVCDLLVYAVSEAYFEARKKLGFSIQP